MSSITNTRDDQPLQESNTNDTADSKVEVRIKTVTIDVFFDGTGNNMFNTDIRLKEDPNKEEKTLKKKLKGQISYENDYSNVAVLYKASTENDSKFKVYTQGAGTLKMEKDDLLGSAFALGPTGIDARIKEAFDKVNKIARKQKADHIVFNVYGFSRGAFFARYFCALAKLDPIDSKVNISVAEAMANSKWQELGRTGRNILQLKSDEITLNFVGIYDTVTSEGLSPNNDAISFRQNIGKKQGIRKIFHLTAQDEFRKHFPLEEINTAITEKNDEGFFIGYECSIPGAHADIGGGYTKPWTDEQDHYLSVFDEPCKKSDLGDPSEIHWSWFKDKGYYACESPSLPKKEGTYGEFRIKKTLKDPHSVYSRQSGDDAKHQYRVYASRHIKGNEYQFVGLNLMHEVAKEIGGGTFEHPDGIEQLSESLNALKSIESLNHFNHYALGIIMKNVNIGGKNHIYIEDCPTLNKETRQEIYHDYIHNTLVANWKLSWKGVKSYFVNGSDRNNKNEHFKPTRIINKDH